MTLGSLICAGLCLPGAFRFPTGACLGRVGATTRGPAKATKRPVPARLGCCVREAGEIQGEDGVVAP